jgi:uncharacterized membrane-anchored protein
MIITARSILLGSALLCAASSQLFSQDSPAVLDQSTVEEAAAAAQKQHEDFMSSLSWQTSGTVALDGRATLEVPPSHRFLGKGDASKLMDYYGNLTDGSELGFISPDNMEWFAVFEFSDVGYVKDDEKDKLDADEILTQLKEGQEAANEELSRRGMSTMQVLGWHTPPFYNTKTNNLEWAIRLSSSEGGEMLNYKTKILGRRGVMDVVLVCDEGQLATVVPQYQEILAKFAYNTDESYASYTKGDKIAEYGLIGLIAGGGLLVAAKSGLLAKLWKPIAIGLVAIGAFIKRIFKGRTPDSI